MFKLASVAALLFAGVAATDSDIDPPPAFPDLTDGTFGGAYARISVTYPKRPCGRLWKRFNDIIGGFVNEDPGEGHYKEGDRSRLTRSWITASRTDKRETETDDVQFLFFPIGDDCFVVGSSAQRGQRPSIYKESAYCAVWDVLKYSDVFTPGSLQHSSSFIPPNPDHDCVHYPKPWRPNFGPPQLSEEENVAEDGSFLN